MIYLKNVSLLAFVLLINACSIFEPVTPGVMGAKHKAFMKGNGGISVGGVATNHRSQVQVADIFVANDPIDEVITANDPVDEVFVIEPEDASLLRNKANNYLMQFDYPNALASFQKVNQLENNALDKLTECMLQDRIESRAPLGCYQTSVQLFEQQLSLSQKDDLSYMLARLLAGDKTAERDAKRLIFLVPEEQRDSYERVLSGFERTNYITTLYP